MIDLDPLKGAVCIRGVMEVDGDRPAGIVQGGDLDSPSVFFRVNS
jgi:hypothetical protein